MKHCLNKKPFHRHYVEMEYIVPEDLPVGTRVRCVKSYFKGYKVDKVYSLIPSWDNKCLVLDNHLTGWDAEWELVSIFTGKEEITDWL